MKTTLQLVFTILLLSSIPAQLSAQRQKVWSIGPEAGVNWSRYGMDASTNERVAGFNGGLFLTYSVINTFAVTGKFLYSEKGAKSGNTEEILKYFEVPLMGRFFFNKSGKFRPNLILGPSFGFLRGVSRRSGTADPVKITNYKDQYHTFDVGATGGLGLNYEFVPQTRLLVDARYTYGLNDLTRRPGQVNNETITVTFGVSFGI